MDFSAELNILIKSHTPAMQVITYEWQRLYGFCVGVSVDNKLDLFSWSVVSGLKKWDKDNKLFIEDKDDKDPLEILDWFKGEEVNRSILILEDFHPFITNENFEIIRAIRELCRTDPSNQKTIIIQTPFMMNIKEFEKEIPILELELPQEETIEAILDSIVNDLDYDNKPNTDKFFLTAWADLSGDGWPYVASQPVTLYVVPLTAKVDFDGSTIGFTGFSAPGYTLVANDITIVKAEAPIITLLGEATMSLELGSTYTDAGATATDNIDGDITSSIVTVNPVDVNTVGTYSVTYNVSDTAGNGAFQVSRIVRVGGIIDVDGNGQYDALTDGLLLLRSMFGLDGNPLVAGTVAPNASYSSPEEIESQIDSLGMLIDIDGNGQIDALTDGLLILRYLFGLDGDILINGVISIDATRTTAPEIEAYLADISPSL